MKIKFLALRCAADGAGLMPIKNALHLMKTNQLMEEPFLVQEQLNSFFQNKPNSSFKNKNMPNSFFKNKKMPNSSFKNKKMPNSSFKNKKMPNNSLKNKNKPNSSFKNSFNKSFKNKKSSFSSPRQLRYLMHAYIIKINRKSTREYKINFEKSYISPR